MTTLNSKVPEGPIKDKWTKYKDRQRILLLYSNAFSYCKKYKFKKGRHSFKLRDRKRCMKTFSSFYFGDSGR